MTLARMWRALAFDAQTPQRSHWSWLERKRWPSPGFLTPLSRP